MKSLILYGSPTKLSKVHKLVTVRTVPPARDPQPLYYVRAKLINADMEYALSIARPQQGETVLNTVEIP